MLVVPHKYASSYEDGSYDVVFRESIARLRGLPAGQSLVFPRELQPPPRGVISRARLMGYNEKGKRQKEQAHAQEFTFPLSFSLPQMNHTEYRHPIRTLSIR